MVEDGGAKEAGFRGRAWIWFMLPAVFAAAAVDMMTWSWWLAWFGVDGGQLELEGLSQIYIPALALLVGLVVWIVVWAAPPRPSGRTWHLVLAAPVITVLVVGNALSAAFAYDHKPRSRGATLPSGSRDVERQRISQREEQAHDALLIFEAGGGRDQFHHGPERTQASSSTTFVESAIFTLDELSHTPFHRRASRLAASQHSPGSSGSTPAAAVYVNRRHRLPRH
jgi:hypothetical protein